MFFGSQEAVKKIWSKNRIFHAPEVVDWEKYSLLKWRARPQCLRRRRDFVLQMNNTLVWQISFELSTVLKYQNKNIRMPEHVPNIIKLQQRTEAPVMYSEMLCPIKPVPQW
jgi:hypothetical protein